MSKKLILFLMLALFGSTSFLRADVIEIGDGTGNTYMVPFNSLYGYSFTEQVYLASEIGTAGTINSISFHIAQAYTTAQTNTYTVWMKHVTRETFATTEDYEPVTAGDVVFNGEWTIPVCEAGEWITLTLDTPFNYDGESNLMFAMHEQTSGYSTRYFYYTAVTNSGISYYSDSYNPDPYNLDGYSGSKTLRSNRNNVQIEITTTPPPTPPTPPTPTGDLTVTPNPFELGIRPLNAWVEPYGVRITNGGAPATITATITTTTPAFELSEDIEDVTLGTDESIDFNIDINPAVEDGHYVGEFTMFYAQSGKSLVQIPVTADLYTADFPDVVEFARYISLTYDAGVATYDDTPEQSALHANYLLQDMEVMLKDAVYYMTLSKDSDVTIETGTTNGVVALYPKTTGVDLHLTPDVEPVVITKTGTLEAPVLAGTYYVVVASNDFETLNVTVAQRPAPTEITNLTPANFTTGVTGSSINLVWEGGENATEYQVLFGTSPTNTAVYQDWTMIDNNYGNFPVSGLVANTQFFWQIKVRNSNGTQIGPRWGFTTALTTPNTVTASAEEIFTDGSTLIKWKFSGGGGGGVLPETQIGSGTTTNNYLPSYSFYNYSLTQQIYTADEIGSAGIINSISFYNGGSEKTRDYTMYLINTDKTAFSGSTDWITATADDQVFTGTVTMAANTWTTFELAEPFSYTGDNLAIIMDDNTGSYSSGMACLVFNATGNQALRVYSDGTNYNPLAPSSYSGTTQTVKNQIIINKESKGVAQDRGFLGFNVYYGDVKANTALITEKQYLLENLPYNLTPGHNVTVTAVYDEGESEQSAPVVVKVSGYATLNGNVAELISGAPVAGATIKVFGTDEFNNDVNYETTTNNSGNYTMTVKAGSYNRGMAMLEGMETAYTEDMSSSSPLVIAYEGTGVANFIMHEVYNPVASVYAEELNENLASIDWTLDPDATRGVSEYYIYRKPILTEEGEEFDSVQLYVAPANAHQYADFGWADQEPGLYLYGVSAHYPTLRGNRDDELTVHDGAATNGYVPVYGFYADAYLKSEMVYPADELADMTSGTINSMKFYATQASVAWGSANFQVFMTEVADPTIAAFVGPDNATIVYEGPLSISNSEMEVLFTTPYNYNGGNLLVGFYNTVTGSYVTSTWNGESVTGASVQGYSYTSLASITPTQRNFLPKTTFSYLAGGGGGVADDPFTPVTWSNILPKDMENMVTVNITTPAGSVEGATVDFVNTFNEEITFSAVADETGVVEFPEFYKGNYEMTVLLEGFDSPVVGVVKEIWSDTTFNVMLTETYKPVDMVSVACTGFASWTDMMPAPERYVERYMIKLDNVYLDEVMENFYQIDTALLEVDQQYTVSVAVVYSTGMSAFVNGSFIYKGCEGVEQQVEGLAVDTAASTGWNVALVWNGGTPGPGPGPTPPTPPTGDTYDFDDGTFQGWTAIDANNDGYNWVLGSQIGGVYLVSGASLAGTGHNSSADMVCSGSYSNATSQAITPDNYLVSPAKAEYTGITFYACAQDASYAAEHFGVAVSTNGNTSGSDFAMVQEWTMTAKDAGAMSIGRDGQTRAQGNWYEKTVDLSAYAGQEIWVAIRHFNCNDQFILNVDDITLGVPEKRETATAETCGKFVAPTLTREPWDLITTFEAAEGGQYGVVTDGEFIYTSNWGYSSAAHNFYKYDMEGNMIEGFDIPGCGTLRGMTFDGEYIYGVANAATIYCVDLKNHTLIGQTTSGYGAMRCISYDPERDGFWVVGNWSGNLTLIDRTGATVFTGPAPSSASDVAYYKDGDGVEHVFCFNNQDNGVYDYNVTTNTMGGQVFNFSQCPGFNSGSSGGCHVANYGDKVAFFGDIQQSPNLIGIYELREAGGGTVVEGLTPNKFNIMVDGEIVAATKDNYFVWTLEENDYTEHEYTVFYVDANFGISCPQTVSYAKQPVSVKENQIVNAIYPNPTSGVLHINATAMTHISIVNAMGQVMFEQDVNADETVVDMAKFESGVYMVNVITENGSSVKRVTVAK